MITLLCFVCTMFCLNIELVVKGYIQVFETTLDTEYE